MVPSQICNYYGFMGTSLSIFASCSTGLYAIEYAQRLCDEYDYVVVGCADANIFYQVVKEFSLIGALGNYNCPFDDKREGFIMSEGSGCLILQSKDKVKEYGSKIYAKLYPAGCASDALDMTSPAPDGRGAKLAINKALKNAEFYCKIPISIDAVSAHATSTIIGDPIEYAAITEYLNDVPIYAPKSKIGHALGSAGILETIYAIESMRNNVIPHCQNLIQCSFDSKNCLVKEPINYTRNSTKRTLNNSFAFGGKCISQVVEVSDV
jgi:3-oxoacyl-[acyl-carrier-protein] synthase II